MRFHIGAVPQAPDFSPDATWTPLREPTTWGMQLFAFPLGALACVVVSVLWIILTPLKAVSFDSPGKALLAGGLSIPIHELIHAAVQPCAGRSANSVLGVWPSRQCGRIRQRRTASSTRISIKMGAGKPTRIRMAARYSGNGWLAGNKLRSEERRVG